MTADVAIHVIWVVLTVTGCLAGLSVLTRFLRPDRFTRVQGNTDGLAERLERIELAVETTAIEVERIAEANRYVAKLLTERGGALNSGKAPERVITPH